MWFFTLLARLPFGVLYRLSDFLFVLIYFVVKYRRKVVDDNLLRSFPEKNSEERQQIARQFYRNFCDIVLETIKLLRVTEAQMQERVHMKNPELFLQPIQNQQVVFIMASHRANWEYSAIPVKLAGPVADVVYKPLSNDFFDRLLLQIRSRFGIRPVAMKQLLRDMAKRRQESRVIGIVADQVPELLEGAYWTNFLHQETDFFTGTDKLARQFGCVVLYLRMQRVARGFYEMEFENLAHPPFDDLPPNAIIERYTRALEADIRLQPDSWLWSHRRFKHVRTV
jgi:Kdo2-lipid IVA lauroyltransferase/acyltransferase